MNGPTIRHCRHCWGGCPGDCLLPGDTGLCLHNPVPAMPFRERVRLVGSRRFWRRLFWGIGATHR